MRIGSLSRHIHNDDFRPAQKQKASPGDLKTSAITGATAGAVAGTVVGAAAGYLEGLDNLKNPTAEVTDKVYYSTRPELIGAHYDDEDSHLRYNSSTEQWETVYDDDDWDPIIERHRVKAYQEPVFDSSQAGLLRAIAGGAVKGAVIGGVVGAVGLTAARAAGWNKLNAKEILDNPQMNIAVGAAAGGIIGGLAGYHAGEVAQKHALVEVRTAPTYETQHIGWMPTERNASSIAREFGKGSGDYRLFYREVGERYGTPPFQGQDPVYSKVPVGEHQQEFLSSGITPIKGALIGTGLGAGLGIVVGVAASVLNRMVEST